MAAKKTVDHEHARRFLCKPLNEASGSAVPRGVRETVEQLLEHHGEPVHPYADRGELPLGLSLEQLAERMGCDKSVASRRVAQAKERGLVADLAGSSNKGRPARLVVVHPLPDDWDVLPAPEWVEKEMRGEMGACLNDQAQVAVAAVAEQAAEDDQI